MPLTAADFFARAQARFTLDVPRSLNDPDATPMRGDHETDPVLRAIADIRPIRPAAVLIGIVERDEPTVLLTQRNADMKDHPGQVAFPGGKIDAGDITPAAAAMREAQEEIGLTAASIHPVGYLDVYMTTLGYRILPLLARIDPDFTLTINPREVDNAFEVPLAFLMEAANHQRHSREWKGMMRSYYAMPFGERYIWGVTAGILRNLYESLYQPAPATSAS